MLDEMGQVWTSSNCMIAPNVTGDVITGTNDPILKYGDEVIEVAGRPLPQSGSPVINALRTQPPAGSVTLKILRNGTVMTVSAICSDERPYGILIADAFRSAARGDFETCAEKFESAQALHESNMTFTHFRFECSERAGKLPALWPPALYEVAHEAIIESAPLPEILEKLRPAIASNEATLTRIGAYDLAARLRVELAAAKKGQLAVLASDDAADRSVARPAGYVAPAAHGDKAQTNSETVPTVLNRVDLIAVVQGIRSFVPKDEFDSPPAQPPIAGRPFSMELTPTEGVSNPPCAGGPTWNYDLKKHELEVTVDTDQHIPTLKTAVPRLQIDCRQISDSTYTAENGAGVAVNVHEQTEYTVSLAIPKAASVEWSAHIEGDDARQLSRAVRILVTGVLGEWARGKVALCYHERVKPTTALPWDFTFRDCAFKADSARIGLIDARTGKVLYRAE